MLEEMDGALSGSSHDDSSDRSFLGRMKVLHAAISLGFLLIISQLWNLQITSGEEYQLLSRKNRIEPVSVAAPRGKILDRAGRVLASNRPGFVLTAVPDQLDAYTLQHIAQSLGIPLQDLEAKMKGPSDEIMLSENVPWDSVVALEEMSGDLQGIRIDVTQRRAYPYGPALAHVIGYVGAISQEEFGKMPPGSYRKNDLIGKDGIERTCESYLKGQDGVKFYEIDARMRRVRQAPQAPLEPPMPGNDLVLTLDLTLQRAADEALGAEYGGVVGLDPRTGEVLCLVSHPSFDPNALVPPVNSKYTQSLFTHPDHPLLDRAVNSAYSPGSTFKPIVAAAALTEKKITPSSELSCEGGIEIGSRRFSCYHKRSHGSLSLHRAICQSCNVFFYQLGLKLGHKKIDEFASQFGLGRKTNILLPSERQGVIPSTLMASSKRQSWYRGDTVNIAIGQGYLSATPLQMACAYSALANGGILFKPSLVHAILSSNGDTLKTFTPEIVQRISLSQEDLAAIDLGLWEVVNTQGGTAHRIRMDFPEVSGKTGTVQLYTQEITDGEVPKELRDHAWFICMAPSESPEIVLVILVEHGGKGGEAAAPVAMKILQSYFGVQSPPPPSEENVL